MTTKFKKGDTLRVINASNVIKLSKDDIVIAASDENGGMIDVIKNGNSSSYKGFFTWRFEKVLTETATGLKVGDTVQIIGSGYGSLPADIGKTTTVTAVHPEDLYGYDASYATAGLTVGDKGHAPSGSYKCNSAKTLRKVDAIDFTKPLFTMEGTPVTLVTTAGRGDKDFPVLAYEGEATTVTKFSLTGVYKYGVPRRNLTNTQPKPVMAETEETQWVNVYKRPDGTLFSVGNYTSRRVADANQSSGRVACQKRVLTLVEGQFDA